MRTYDDIVEAEVKRRLTEILASAGISSSRLSQEILYMLPEEFVRMYRELHDRALEDARNANAGGGTAKASGAETRSFGMRTRSMAGASGKDAAKGRRVRGYWWIRDEDALNEKGKLDRKLIRAAAKALQNLKNGGVDSKDDRCPECGRYRGDEAGRNMTARVQGD